MLGNRAGLTLTSRRAVDQRKDMANVDISLALVREGGVANTVTMRRAKLIIGRKPECEIRIPVPDVSREHCEIRVEAERVLVKDLGSSNGTYVDGQRVQEAELKAGSVLTVGPATFVVQVDGKPASIDAAAVLQRGATKGASVTAPAAAVRPASPAKPSTSKAGGVPAKAEPAAGGKPAAKKSDDSDFDFDPDDSSISDLDLSDLLKDDDEDQPKL